MNWLLILTILFLTILFTGAVLFEFVAYKQEPKMK